MRACVRFLLKVSAPLKLVLDFQGRADAPSQYGRKKGRRATTDRGKGPITLEGKAKKDGLKMALGRRSA